MARIRNAVMAAGVLVIMAAPAGAWAYSALFAFGDSLSDSGNSYLASAGLFPAAPYAGGHFSNGPTWIEDVSVKLGLGPLAPALAGGTNFAFGGAQTGFAGIPQGVPGIPNLSTQVGGLFLPAMGGVAPGAALYSVWIGANDVEQILLTGQTPGQAVASAIGAAQTEAAVIGTLVGAGARHFLVPLLPDLGQTPELMAFGPTVAGAGTFLSQTFNSALLTALQAIDALPDVDVHVLDTFSAMGELIANPGAYGLSNATGPCHVGPYTGGGTVCGDPGAFLFWDMLHPTAAGHLLLADAAMEALPEPAALAVFGVGLIGLAWVLRRRTPWIYSAR